MATTAGVIGNDINNTGMQPFFSDQALPVVGGQVTAMFHGAVRTSNAISGSVNSLKSTGGYIDLYCDDPTRVNTIVNISALTPGMRKVDASFTNVTDIVFLGRLAFAIGINPGSATSDIHGTIDTSLANNSGLADSYANVVDFNGDGKIDPADGL